MLGVPTSERRMAELTHTRPSSGATLIRALDGLNHRLKHTRIAAELVEPTYAQLDVLPKPMLTPLQLEPTQQHMVVIRRTTPGGVCLIDPQEGFIAMTEDQFRAVYTGQVIVFRR
jgi:predicted double-glycine peptidase